MGLWSLLTGRHRRSAASSVTSRTRAARFEAMESRRNMAADPIKLGMVYIEEDGGSDLHGDRFELQFEGGAPGTELKQVVIDTDHGPAGLSVGDMIFDTVKGGLGADEAFDLQVVSSDGIGSVKWQVTDGGMKLIFDFTGFQAGDKLVFTVDVDEIQDYDPAETDLARINEGVDPIASGVEFQGSKLGGTFAAANYFDVSGTGEFRNLYDPLFAGSNLLASATNPNGLPADNFQGRRDRTTGVMFPLQQQPKPVELSGYVYVDADNDGVRDTGEKPISGVTVRVIPVSTIQPQGEVLLTTDANGFYRATNLMPGRYRVVEVQPSAYFDGKDAAGTVGGVVRGQATNPGDNLENIDLAGGDVGIEYNFGELEAASIRGHVHLTDRFGNCDETVAGPLRPIEGAEIRLFDQSGKLLRTAFTDANGEYAFLNLAPGQYSVVELTPDGLIDGDEHVGKVKGQNRGSLGGNDLLKDIVLGSGDDGVDYDFCEHEPAEVSGYVYHDENNDGVYDVLETPIAFAELDLIDANGQIVGSTVTDDVGFYRFGGLAAGTYRIVEHQPATFDDGLDTPGTIAGMKIGSAVNPGDRINGVALQWGDAGVDYNFGELRLASIAGQVFVDLHRDCLKQADEPALAGVTVELYGEQGQLLGTTKTGADGRYSFDGLVPGRYTVRELQPTGYFQGGQTKGNKGGDDSQTDVISRVDIHSGDEATEYNFCEVPPAKISGLVYVDLSRDCIRQDDEPPLSGVTVQLFNEQGGLVGTTTTDAAGQYRFEALPPGKYTVREQQPTGWFQGGQVAGTKGGDASQQDVISAINLEPGDDALHYDFCEVPPNAISGQVWVDIHRDCIRQDDEAPLAGVTIQLFSEQGQLLATTKTDANGQYRFDNLAPGKYEVREQQPAGYFTGGQTKGTTGGDDSQVDRISGINLPGGLDSRQNNFCEVPPAVISGYVFRDGPVITTSDGLAPANLNEIRDGVLTPDDLRLAGVTLELRYTGTADPVLGEETLAGVNAPGVLRVQTDANGYYEFRGLPVGNYSVLQVQPVNYIDSKDTPGTLGGLAINVGATVSPSFLQPFAAAGVSLNHDAILRIGLEAGVHARLNNFSEVQVTRLIIPPPLPPDRPDPPKVDKPVRPAFVEILPLQFFPTPKTEELITGGGSPSYAWHLSVINNGNPRATSITTWINGTPWRPAGFMERTGKWGEALELGRWSLPGAEPNLRNEALFGLPGAIPVVGDFNGDGHAEIGVYVNGEWFIDLNGNGRWDEGDLWARLGSEVDRPVVGDWDGDGKDDIGIFGQEWNGDRRQIDKEPGLPDVANPLVRKPKNVPPDPEDATEGVRRMRKGPQGEERSDVIDHVFRFGVPTDVPVAGDWNGDGVASIGVFRDGKWHFDEDGDGKWSAGDKIATFGQAGDRPVVGDFDGDGRDEIGVYRNGKWILDSNSNRELDDQDRTFELGTPADLPAVGDFNGDGVDEPAIYTPITPPTGGAGAGEGEAAVVPVE